MEQAFESRRIKNRNYFPFIIVILIIIGIGVVSFYTSYNSFKEIVLTREEKYITVEQGETIGDVLSKNFQVDGTLLSIYLKNNIPEGFTLKAGNFKISENAGFKEFFSDLQKPIYDHVVLTFLEGWNIYDIDEYLASKELVNTGDFEAYAQTGFKNLSSEYSFIKSALSLEGFLYPDTYYFDPIGLTPEKVARKMLQNFGKKVINTLEKNYTSKEIVDIINLASIVEKEERKLSERPTVAGILKKRLNEGWMIGADITVCYPYELTSEECKMVVSKYIREENEYNTRTMTGLPKTPIGNPSISSINAVINPKESAYYFYLHDTVTGQIYYGKDDAEHEENKRRYLR